MNIYDIIEISNRRVFVPSIHHENDIRIKNATFPKHFRRDSLHLSLINEDTGGTELRFELGRP